MASKGRDHLVDLIESGPYCSTLDGERIDGYHPDCLLDAIPNGWAKVEDEWVKVSDLLAQHAEELGYLVRKVKN